MDALVMVCHTITNCFIKIDARKCYMMLDVVLAQLLIAPLSKDFFTKIKNHRGKVNKTFGGSIHYFF